MADGGPIIFHKRRTFAWKTAVLTIVTVAFIPVLLYKNHLGGQFYVGSLVVIHIIAMVTFLIGVKRQDIAPTAKGFWGRMVGLLFVTGLLYLSEKGFRTPNGTDLGSALFWWSLFGIWAVHTGGLAMLHLRGKKEQACIFAAEQDPTPARAREPDEADAIVG